MLRRFVKTEIPLRKDTDMEKQTKYRRHSIAYLPSPTKGRIDAGCNIELDLKCQLLAVLVSNYFDSYLML